MITAIDEATVGSPDDLGTAIAEHLPGDQIRVTYERGGRSQTVTVTLGARPSGS